LDKSYVIIDMLPSDAVKFSKRQQHFILYSVLRRNIEQTPYRSGIEPAAPPLTEDPQLDVERTGQGLAGIKIFRFVYTNLDGSMVVFTEIRRSQPLHHAGNTGACTEIHK
jgi:hypothetical protein